MARGPAGEYSICTKIDYPKSDINARLLVVNLSQLSHNFGLGVTPSKVSHVKPPAAESAPPLATPVEPDGERYTSSGAVEYAPPSLSLSAPTLAPAEDPKPVDSGTRPSYNQPLAYGLEYDFSVTTVNGVRFEGTPELGLTPVYMGEIRVLDKRYPGVADKLKELEMQALQLGYCPVGSKQVETAMLESPPWPTTSFGDPREAIKSKASELRAAHPELDTQDASRYDFSKAARDSEALLQTLDGLFPEAETPGLSISARAKTPGSLARKMEKMVDRDPEFTLAHLTDTVGARIDAPDLRSMGEVARRLEKLYEGKIVAKSDYVSQPGDNGYRAIHYTVDMGGRMVEIQTSTHSLRTADLVTHDTVYKAEFPVSPETSKELQSVADRIMFLESLKAQQPEASTPGAKDPEKW